LLAGLAVLAASMLAVWHLPLPWPGGLPLPALYIGGIWAALVLAVTFIAGYVFSLAAEAQRMSDALSATQMALAREQRLSALGGLAAAAAHELGSPLSTIAVVARELASELPDDSPYKEDADLLLHESARCRDILASLAHKPEDDGGQPFNRLPLSALVEAAVAPFDHDTITLAIAQAPRDDSLQPEVTRKPEILHGVGTLVENAMRFARSRVDLEVAWDALEAQIAIRDDGPGFAEGILPFLGEPYLSSHGHESGGEHMGLGVFIARTLLARTGAEVIFANRPGNGAEVVITWPRAHLEEGEHATGRSEEERAR
jgi:two-component system sensor histidine kinase RegB